MSGRRRAFSGSPVSSSRSRAVKFIPPRSDIHLLLFGGEWVKKLSKKIFVNGVIIIVGIIIIITLTIRNQKQFTSGSVEWDFSDGDGSTTPPSPPNCSDTTQVILMVMMMMLIMMVVMMMAKVTILDRHPFGREARLCLVWRGEAFT